MSELLTKSDVRTHYCAALSKTDIGSSVCVTGWVGKARNLGSLLFIDLRDRTGIVQLAFDDQTPADLFAKAGSARSEYVLLARGTVRARAAGAINKNISTGEVEVYVSELKILSSAVTPPFEIVEGSTVKSELRLKHRYLDLRRPDLARNIIARSKIAKIARDYFYEQGFIDVETPNLCLPTPEGARDYLVPSRVHPGNFYALPQSPQLYKQLLMLAGFDKYIQIARCFRDEDLRADRQPEFTQIDLEMSFITQDTIMEVVEGFLARLFREFKGTDLKTPLRRMTYAEAMERYGSDKPDLRFGLEFHNLTETLRGCSFKVFAEAVSAGGSVRAIVVPNGAERFSRKDIDSLTDYVRTYKAKGLAWYKNAAEASSSYAKFLTDSENAAISKALDLKIGDLALIIADKNSIVEDALGALRCEVARRAGLIKEGQYELLWVTEFPLLEFDEEDNRYYAKHHPFTMPMAEDIDLLDSAPEKVRSIAYDIVINGTEAGGGSIRIHSSDIQSRMFKVLGFTPEQAEEKFGFLLEAFKYGAPPHGGLAFGLDRLVTLMLGLTDIRDVIAFPKVQNASEIMTRSPGPADEKALRELHIKVAE